MRQPSLSVIIAASRLKTSLNRCLESISRAAVAGPEEILVILNQPEEEPKLPTLPNLRLIATRFSSLGAARNVGVLRASGDILVFLDDDVTVPPDYFSLLADALERYPEAAAIGGPNLTPPDSPLFQRCAGYLLGSWLGAGKMSRRYRGFATDTWTDDSSLILCNLAIRRRALQDEALMFPEDITRNEENLLLAELKSRGHKLLHSPALAVLHDRRATLGAFLRQCFLSGVGRGQMTLKSPASLHWVCLGPLALAAAVAGFPLAPALLGPGLTLYLGASLACGLPLLFREGWKAACLLAALFPLCHLSYALGLVRGILLGMKVQYARLDILYHRS